MVQAYNAIVVQCTTFTRLKIGSLSSWAVTSEKYDLIVRMKGIKGLIFKHDDAKYFYTGMRSALRGFLNLCQGGMLGTEYHKWWTSIKNIAEEFRYKIGNIDRATNRECEAGGIFSTNSNYIAKQEEVKSAAREIFLAATFLLGAYRCQYRGMMT